MNSDETSRAAAKALAEMAGLLRGPQRVFPLIRKLASDGLHNAFETRHLYSYSTTKRDTAETLNLVMRWMHNAQRADGGIAAYYSLLTRYSESYPEVTGYIVPTLYDFAQANGKPEYSLSAERATRWLLSLQMPNGAFPGGLHKRESRASIFNSGQILHGLVGAHAETHRDEISESAIRVGDWLANSQQADGSWSGPAAYQGVAHTYYSMVAWALAQLAESTNDPRHRVGAEKNMDWTLSHFRPSGWIDGINLRGHPIYLHFIAYVLQGVLECGILLERQDAIEAVAKSAWVLLRKFETNKYLAGAYEADFKQPHRFACLTGNAQMSCVWLRLYETTNDLRYLNAALKMNEMLKERIPRTGGSGIVGGVSGSYPTWCRYQPLRYISWGCKFFADALMLEQRIMRSLQAASSRSAAADLSLSGAMRCAS